MDEKRKAERTGRAPARPARVAPAHATGVLLAIVAVLSLLSAKAYALPGSELNGYPLGEILMSERLGEMRATCVYGASNEFFATLCLIGRKSDYLQLSNDQLSELSGEGTGGAFYELSQRWNNYAADGGPTNDDGYSIGFRLAIDGQSLISDPAYIWYADYSYYDSDSLYQRALDDYLTIYNGGHLGGGGDFDKYLDMSPVGMSCRAYSSATTWDSYACPAYVLSEQFYYPSYESVRNGRLAASDFRISLSGSLYSQVTNDVSSGYKYYYCKLEWSTSRYRWFLHLYLFKEKPSLNPLYATYNGVNYLVGYSVQGGSCVLYSDSSVASASINQAANLDQLADLFTYSSATRSVLGSVSSGFSTYTSAIGSNVIDGSGGGGGGGGTWPEPDPTPQPDPPDVPEPDEPSGPGIDPPNPIGYTIDPTDDPDPVTDPYVVVVAPDSQDIIPWLRAILQAINNLGDKLNDESTELQRALNQVFFTNLSKLLKNLKGEFLQDFTQWLDLELEWMMESIESLFLDLQDYLHELFEWLADQMNFEFDSSIDPYDDTSLLNWLRRIYNKLGADGGPNTQPVDPSTDPEGFLDWLRRMIQEFILGLGASASDLVSDIGDLLSRLFGKFPFSVPWDILAILGMLDAPPVAPHIQFSIPVPLGADSFNWSVDIDMQVWSTYVEAVRTVILLSFITWLAWLTPQVLRDLDPGDFL